MRPRISISGSVRRSVHRSIRLAFVKNKGNQHFWASKCQRRSYHAIIPSWGRIVTLWALYINIQICIFYYHISVASSRVLCPLSVHPSVGWSVKKQQISDFFIKSKLEEVEVTSYKFEWSVWRCILAYLKVGLSVHPSILTYAYPSIHPSCFRKKNPRNIKVLHRMVERSWKEHRYVSVILSICPSICQFVSLSATISK